MPRRGKTQKKQGKSAKKILSIPELRSSMEHMSSYATKLRHSNSSIKQNAKLFVTEWKRVFGKTLSPKVAEDYLKHSQHMKNKKFTRKHRGGGVPLTGAPLDYMTRPGAELPHGSYQKYLNGGFFPPPQPGVLTDGGMRQGVVPQAGMGSNKMSGGGIIDSISTGIGAILTRPFVAENPQSTQHGIMTAWKGLPSSPGGASYQQTWPYVSAASSSAFPSPSIYTRTLGQQGQI